MPFTIEEVREDAEFDEITKVEWTSYEQPFCRLRPLFFPIFGQSVDARAMAIRESTRRQLQWHKADPSSYWIKVVDDETKKLAGAACWHIFDSNPYATPSEEECTWWPEGEERELANSLMAQFLTPRMTYMSKPHTCDTDEWYLVLDLCFVHPDFRRRGAGKLLVDWGMRKADELELESYVDSTEDGIPLYEACGYFKAEKVDFDASKSEPSARWKELEKELLPFSFWPMWRPAGAKTKYANLVKPWEHWR